MHSPLAYAIARRELDEVSCIDRKEGLEAKSVPSAILFLAMW